MKKLILSIVLLLSFSTVNATNLLTMTEIERQWFKLKPYQRINLIRIFQRAAEDDLSWTAVAIAWEESKYGRFQMGFPKNGSYDCGVMHNNTTSVLARKGLKPSLYNKLGVCTSLIVNPEESYLEFVKEVRYWERVRGAGEWSAIWRGYNAGYTGGGKNYSTMISRRIRTVKKFLPALIDTEYYSAGELRIEKDPKSI